jgi:hypothetical protein
MSNVETSSTVDEKSAIGAVTMSAIGAGLFVWGITYAYYIAKKMRDEKTANVPLEERTKNPWWVYSIIVLGFVLLLLSFIRIYTKVRLTRVVT